VSVGSSLVGGIGFSIGLFSLFELFSSQEKKIEVQNNINIIAILFFIIISSFVNYIFFFFSLQATSCHIALFA